MNFVDYFCALTGKKTNMEPFYWLVIIWAINELSKWEQQQNEGEDSDDDESECDGQY